MFLCRKISIIGGKRIFQLFVLLLLLLLLRYSTCISTMQTTAAAVVITMLVIEVPKSLEELWFKDTDAISNRVGNIISMIHTTGVVVVVVDDDDDDVDKDVLFLISSSSYHCYYPSFASHNYCFLFFLFLDVPLLYCVSKYY